MDCREGFAGGVRGIVDLDFVDEFAERHKNTKHSRGGEFDTRKVDGEHSTFVAANQLYEQTMIRTEVDARVDCSATEADDRDLSGVIDLQQGTVFFCKHRNRLNNSRRDDLNVGQDPDRCHFPVKA